MEPERWRQAEELYEQGLEAGAEERERLLAGAPEDIAAVVRELWAKQAEVGTFLERPVVKRSEVVRQFADGQVIGGRFRIEALLGAGGMGEVYRALDERLGRTVAVKVLLERLSSDPELRSRFEREARSVCSLNHPRICALYDAGWEGRNPFLVMEHLSGETLAERLARGRMPLEELLAVAEGLADALAYAHGHGVVHRDLKPSNIMLTEHGPKLFDFGIAKRVVAEGEQAETLTQTASGAVIGSVAYMSPEQAEGRTVDHRSDVFSFGAVVYEMATGQRAFQGDTNVSTLAAVLQRDPAPIKTLAPASPAELDALVRRCLRKKAEERYGGMGEVLLGLRGIARPTKRWKWVAAGLVAALVLAVAGVAIWRKAPVERETVLPRPVQLTADQGQAGDPNLSPDGKWLAYASDRGVTGRWGIHIQRLDGSESRKLAECGAGGDPVFTPNGEEIIYACGETFQNTNLYSVSRAGGPSKLLAEHGSWPTISPDGITLAYVEPASQRLAVKPIAEGDPVVFSANQVLGRAVWSPDGDKLLYLGGGKFVIATRNGGSTRETSLLKAIHGAGWERDGMTHPLLYAWTKEFVYLTFRTADGTGVWRVPFDSRQEIPTGPPARVSSLPNAWNGGVQQDKLVVDVMTTEANVFMLDLEKHRRGGDGALRQLSFDSALTTYPRISGGGEKISYISTPAGPAQLYVLDVAAGQRTLVAQLPGSPRAVRTAAIAPDGRQVAWGENDGKDLYISETDRPKRRLVCAGCGSPWAWTPDGTALITAIPPREESGTLYRVDPETGRRTVFMMVKHHGIADPTFSKDGDWIAFLDYPEGQEFTHQQLYVAPVKASSEGPSVDGEVSSWIPIGLKSRWRFFDWAHSGDRIYELDVFKRRLVAIPLNGDTKYQSGPPIPLYQFPADPNLALGWLSAADGFVVTTLGRTRRNIWMQDLPK